ncbi:MULTISPECIES: PilZ domain-containing protein [unclassified Sphingomonas]|jgi:hypothetical protein|uniref:PilZ domain-containing protein n=1 Tax=unclassified Sphingomonas TaxID=196159 RepID=UPI00226A73DB|nr:MULTISPECIES: PilZ domain-containing protein [unclassified Sphingomonas]
MTDIDPSQREPRSSVIIRAGLELPGGTVERRVRNLSRLGACVDQEGELVTGTTITLALGSIRDLKAEVMWTKPQLAGLRFHQPVNLDDARKPRRAGTVTKAGWMANMDNAYRRVG